MELPFWYSGPAQTFLSVHIPFSLVSYPLNILALAISYKYLGKRFILYTCLAVGLSGAVTDLIPAFLMTEDVLLCSIFGGICNGVCVSICMMSEVLPVGWILWPMSTGIS